MSHLRRLVIAIALMACTGAASAAPAEMEIAAKTTTYDGKAHTYHVVGSVRVTLPHWVVTCDEATLYASSGEEAIARVVFRGNVTAMRGTDTFRADRVTYDVNAQRLTAEGATRTHLKLPARAQGPVSGP